MLAGYVTYEELKLITGYPDRILNQLIINGLNIHECDVDRKKIGGNTKQMLFNIQEVEDWLKVHVF